MDGRRIGGWFDHVLPDARELLLLRGNGHIIARLIPAALLLDDALDAAHLAQLVVVFALGRLARVHLQLEMPRIVAARDDRRTLRKLDGAIGHPVEKIAVVRHDDIGAAAGEQKLLQPLDGADVQVVGRLVEQQQGRFGEQHARQQRLAHLAAAQALHRPPQRVLGKSQAEQYRARTAAVCQAAPALILLLQPVLTANQRVVRPQLQPLRQCGELPLQLHERRKLLQRRVQKRHARSVRLLLHEPRDAAIGCALYPAFVRHVLAAEQAQQRRLPAAVDADQSDPVSRGDLKRHVGKQLALPKLFCKALRL